MVLLGFIGIAGKIVAALGMLLVVSACAAAGIGALAAGGALGASAVSATKPNPSPAHASPPQRTGHSPTLLPVTPNY